MNYYGGEHKDWKEDLVLIIVVDIVLLALYHWIFHVMMVSPFGELTETNPVDLVGPNWTRIGTASYKWPLFDYDLEARVIGGKYQYRVTTSKGVKYHVRYSKKVREGTLLPTDAPNPNFPSQRLTLRANLLGMS